METDEKVEITNYRLASDANEFELEFIDVQEKFMSEVWALPPGNYTVSPEQYQILQCRTCRHQNQFGEPQFGPPHFASKRCESGGRDHCSCDICF